MEKKHLTLRQLRRKAKYRASVYGIDEDEALQKLIKRQKRQQNDED